MGKVYFHWFKLGLIAGFTFSAGFTIYMLSQDWIPNRDPFLIGITVILSSLGIGIHVGFIGLIAHLIRTRGSKRKENRF